MFYAVLSSYSILDLFCLQIVYVTSLLYVVSISNTAIPDLLIVYKEIRVTLNAMAFQRL